ncbi:MAG: hypothetical protein ACLRFE_04420 [Clostridia bacterium]
MEYNINHLAYMYALDLSQKDFDVTIPSQSFDHTTYNEYTYQKLMMQFNKLYDLTDTIHITEEFLKGD